MCCKRKFYPGWIPGHSRYSLSFVNSEVIESCRKTAIKKRAIRNAFREQKKAYFQCYWWISEPFSKTIVCENSVLKCHSKWASGIVRREKYFLYGIEPFLEPARERSQLPRKGNATLIYKRYHPSMRSDYRDFVESARCKYWLNDLCCLLLAVVTIGAISGQL